MMVPTCEVSFFGNEDICISMMVGGCQDFRRQRGDKIGQGIKICFYTLFFPASHCSCRAKMTELILWARNAFDISCFTFHKTRRSWGTLEAASCDPMHHALAGTHLPQE